MNAKEVEFVKWFSELSNKDVQIAGGKGASLGEMYNLKMPVPPGFVITAQSYSFFIEKTGINEEIKKVIENLDVNNIESLNRVSKKIREIIENARIPKEMESAIVEAYEILGAENPGADVSGILKEPGSNPFVAVRSSATTEDLADASFAGQQETFLNVKGARDLIGKVKKCISSLFTARAIYYREKKGFKYNQARLAVVVQKMINAEKSGVMFSRNPTRSDKTIVIEAVWGLGEGIVSGQIKPDHYVVSPDMENFKILETEISNKKIAIIRDEEGKTKKISLDIEKAEKRVLDNYEIKRLAQFAKKLEEHYKKPQDIEFAIEGEGIFIVQSRPITTTYSDKNIGEVIGEIILSGLGASPGIASGKVKIIHDLAELEKVQRGDVLVTEMTNPDMVVSMQRAAAIITDEGGITSHAAIVSREMGIPAVVGTSEATKKLKDDEIVTVDGNTGKIFAGEGKTKLVEIEPIVQTKTEIKVIVDLPDFAERAAKSGAKAVGLLRLEGIIASGGKHPMKFVKDKKTKDYITLISKGIKKISSHFNEVWVRTSDIRTDEFRNLEGSSKEVEGNPMLGNHGIRYSLKNPEILKAELTAIKEVADDFPEKIFGVMMPQIISVDELRQTKKIAGEINLPENVKMGIMVETPAAVQIIDDLCREGIDFISFGTNDLTQFTLAIDRNNEEVQDIYNENHPAVLRSLSHVIQVCKKHKVKTSICGQAGSREDMARFLVNEGIDSISVNADSARKISELISSIESLSRGNEDAGTQQINVHPKKEKNGLFAPMISSSSKYQPTEIEEEVLKALDANGTENTEKSEYLPSVPEDKNKKEIPSLNESIPIDSEYFEEESASKEELDEEWNGESKR